MTPTNLARPITLFLAALVATRAAAAPAKAVAVPAPIIISAAGSPRAPRSSSSCVDGKPAALASESGGGWDISYASVNPDGSLGEGYTVSGDFLNAHHVSDHILGIGPNNDQYGAFKCQFVCNDAAGCVSYFGKYEETGPDAQNYKCVLFKKLLDPSVFVPDSASKAAGGYNKLCSQKAPAATSEP